VGLERISQFLFQLSSGPTGVAETSVLEDAGAEETAITAADKRMHQEWREGLSGFMVAKKCTNSEIDWVGQENSLLFQNIPRV